MPLLAELMPMLSLSSVACWTILELGYLQSHLEVLGSALASAMQFALAEAASSVNVSPPSGQLHQEHHGMLDQAGAGILQVIISIVQQCSPQAILKVGHKGSRDSTPHQLVSSLTPESCFTSDLHS